MVRPGTVVGVGVGLVVGAIVAATWCGRAAPVLAGSNDRFQDYAMATGAVAINPKLQTDGVWLLDYKSGKLLGTVIDKSQGKIVGWAEVDLVNEYGVEPKQDVHFMMATGWIASGQSALYVAETTTGKFGVYTMGPGQTGTGVAIRRHDLTSFRKAAEPVAAPLQPGPMPGLPPAVPKVGG